MRSASLPLNGAIGAIQGLVKRANAKNEHDIEHNAERAHAGHDGEHRSEAMGTQALGRIILSQSGEICRSIEEGVIGTKMRHSRSFPIIQPACEQPGEQKRAQWNVENQEVVEQSEVLQSEQFRRCRHRDRYVHSVAHSHYDRADVQGAWCRSREQHVAEEEKHL